MKIIIYHWCRMEDDNQSHNQINTVRWCGDMFRRLSNIHSPCYSCPHNTQCCRLTEYKLNGNMKIVWSIDWLWFVVDHIKKTSLIWIRQNCQCRAAPIKPFSVLMTFEHEGINLYQTLSTVIFKIGSCGLIKKKSSYVSIRTVHVFFCLTRWYI